MTDRPVRDCTRCGNSDTAPRHVLGARSRYHLDCHAKEGCLSCEATVTASGGLTDTALESWLTEQRETSNG